MLEGLSIQELDARLIALRKREREALCDLIEHLAAFDRKDGALALAYSSLFEYCVRKLGYSEGAAYKRIRAARATGIRSCVLEALREGRVHLAALAVIKPYLTEENAPQLLDRAAGKTKEELGLLAAELA